MITELLISARTAAINTIIAVFNTKNTLKQLWILGRLHFKNISLSALSGKQVTAVL